MTKVSQTDLIAGAIAGKVVSFPTDTVPALAVKPEFASRIFQLKQRPADKPLILMGASISDLLAYVLGSKEDLTAWGQTFEQYFPGAITFILPASTKVPAVINPTNSTTVGIRVPDHPLACQILNQTGVLATSSANISGQNTLTTMTAIEQVFPDVLVLEEQNLDPKDKIGSGLPSTVAQWKNQGWSILRQGSVIIKPFDHHELNKPNNLDKLC